MIIWSMGAMGEVVSGLVGRRFDLGRAAQAAGWQRELLGDAPHAPEAAALGIASLVYRAPRPFHPGRLWRAVLEDAALPPVLRAKVTPAHHLCAPSGQAPRSAHPKRSSWRAPACFLAWGASMGRTDR